MQSSYSYTAKHHVQITTVFGLPKIMPVEARKVLFESTAIAVILGNPNNVVICT
jgi:hypothetical protein